MNVKDRLTGHNEVGQGIINMDGVKNELEARERIRRFSPFIISRLTDYEDTGLSPDEINALKTENAALRERLEKSVELQNDWISVEKSLPETDHENTHSYNVLVYIPEREGCTQQGIYIGKLAHVDANDGTGNFWGIKIQACEWTIWGWSYFEHPIVTHWKPLSKAPVEFEARLAELKGGER